MTDADLQAAEQLARRLGPANCWTGNPTQSEEHVTQQGDDLTRILWALGYRRTEA